MCFVRNYAKFEFLKVRLCIPEEGRLASSLSFYWTICRVKLYELTSCHKNITSHSDGRDPPFPPNHFLLSQSLPAHAPAKLFVQESGPENGIPVIMLAINTQLSELIMWNSSKFTWCLLANDIQSGPNIAAAPAASQHMQIAKKKLVLTLSSSVPTFNSTTCPPGPFHYCRLLLPPHSIELSESFLYCLLKTPEEHMLAVWHGDETHPCLVIKCMLPNHCSHLCANVQMFSQMSHSHLSGTLVKEAESRVRSFTTSQSWGFNMHRRAEQTQPWGHLHKVVL